uniref:GTP cyclohydrolase II n=1 Tax=Eutreptiella gymnastica TaxID=73025 RepID=A0A7S4CVI3_9EUGL
MYATSCFQTTTMVCPLCVPNLSSMVLDVTNQASLCTQCARSSSSRKLVAALSVMGTAVGITMAVHTFTSGTNAAPLQLQSISPTVSHGLKAWRSQVVPSMRQPARRGVSASALADSGVQISDPPLMQVRSESAQAQVLSAAETIAPSVVMERPSEEFLRAERASKVSSILGYALALGGLLLGAWAVMRGQRATQQTPAETAAEGSVNNYASMGTAPNAPPINQLVYAFTEKSAEETVVSMATPHKERTRFVAETLLPTTSGTYRVRSYKHTLDGITFTDPIAIIAGKPEGAESVPVRVHDACWTSEVIGSLKCDCAQQLAQAMDYIRDNEQGIVLYLHQEGRGIGLANKIAAYRMQEQGVDTVEANRMLGLPDDSREYTAVKDILEDINVQSIGLMTNNPRKVKELRSLGISISKRISCIVADPGEIASQYVQTKREQMGHFDSDEEDVDVLCVWTEDEQKAQRFGTKGAHGDGGF